MGQKPVDNPAEGLLFRHIQFFKFRFKHGLLLPFSRGVFEHYFLSDVRFLEKRTLGRP